MAIAAASVFEVRTTGSDTNGGGFVAGASGTDFSQQDAAQYSGTNLAIDAATATKVTSATHNFVAADVGNLMQITAGTGFTTGFYQIVSVASNAATLDRSAGTLGSTGGTFAVGGALASPGKAAGAVVAGNDVWIKSGTYSITTASTNVSGGCLSLPGHSGSTNHQRVRGYTTTRGDTVTRPVLQLAVGTATIITGVGGHIEWLECDGNNQTSSRGLTSNGQPIYARQCIVRNCTNGGIVVGSTSLLDRCEITGCSGATACQLGASTAFACNVHDNTVTGFGLTVSAVHLQYCLSYNNSGASSFGFTTSDGGATFQNCIAYNNGSHGFQLANNNANSIQAARNCIAANNGGYGFNATNSPAEAAYLTNCAAYSNTSGAYPAAMVSSQVENFVTLTASPFVNAASGNFALNTTAGGGAACRATGIPGVFPGATATGYLDIGAVQHADPTGGGNWIALS